MGMRYGCFIKLMYSPSLKLKICNRFNRQQQENNKIKFWKSVPSYVLVRKYQWRKKIIFIPSNKWENLKNVLFYRYQIAYNANLVLRVAERGNPKGNVDVSWLLHSRILIRVKRHLRCDRLWICIIKSGLAQSVERLFYKTPGRRFRPQWFFSAFFFFFFSFSSFFFYYCHSKLLQSGL